MKKYVFPTYIIYDLFMLIVRYIKQKVSEVLRERESARIYISLYVVLLFVPVYIAHESENIYICTHNRCDPSLYLWYFALMLTMSIVTISVLFLQLWNSNERERDARNLSSESCLRLQLFSVYQIRNYLGYPIFKFCAEFNIILKLGILFFWVALASAVMALRDVLISQLGSFILHNEMSLRSFKLA